MRMDIPGIIFVRARLVLESHSVQVVCIQLIIKKY